MFAKVAQSSEKELPPALFDAGSGEVDATPISIAIPGANRDDGLPNLSSVSEPLPYLSLNRLAG